MVAPAELGLDLHDRGKVSLDGGCIGPGKLEQIGIALVRHDARTGSEVAWEDEVAELFGGEENHVLRQASQIMRELRTPEERAGLELAPPRLEHLPDRLIGDLGMLVRLGVGDAAVEQQRIQQVLADVATEIDAARLLTERAAQAKDRGEDHRRFAAQAKYYASEIAVRATDRALQIHGGYGFIKDYPVEKLMRDAKIMQLYEGTSQIQRLVIARETLLPRRIEAVESVAA